MPAATYWFRFLRIAPVLFLTAIAGNFEWNALRAVMLAVALGMLLFGLYHLLTYPIR